MAAVRDFSRCISLNPSFWPTMFFLVRFVLLTACSVSRKSSIEMNTSCTACSLSLTFQAEVVIAMLSL
ncbi:hypothetical protein HDV57DRAFT_161947 [Trichoderma longibrachiatum]|uniref:Uncharacterized protein n=1 Tax=Trichoderma longibrachiatum ATCC 18648 TaxID=983965 RepID=A0A2T4C1A1_TRILO|nr:hypothetical protein M440DRAFT_341074 [Trichoderma longibrachiatum ATCC 18648]